VRLACCIQAVRAQGGSEEFRADVAFASRTINPL
jgi:hypothetical protein